QARTAPGSSFKMVTAATALERGVISPGTYLTTHGSFSAAGMKVDCWYYPNAHGDITVSDALMVSCNDFFAQVAYRLSLVDGNYNDSVGIEKISEYARLLGLGEKSGVEIPESNPVISDISALTSAIGQGTNLYSCSHLARYATALASRGNIYRLTLLDHESTAEGSLIQSYRGELVSHATLQESTWNSIWEGMRRAVTSGSHANVYSQKVTIAAKTGTAEENELRPDHVTYVSFAPYENPEISVSLMIPNGYTSGNTSELAGYVYDYYYGHITYEDILNGHARDAGGNNINE
ncbi:MAG: penicillin-binding protein, partial [Lachnospiraceae bacterium]|nr:penicillin-binding protein [Lachnospiraceae bacterium]